MDEEEDSRLGHILSVTGLSLDQFVPTFGAAWHHDVRPVDWNADEDPDGEFVEWDRTPWHLGGTPVQLMLRAFGHGVFVALPEARRVDHLLVYQPGEQVYVSGLELRGVLDPADPYARLDQVAHMLRRRRASFRRCRYCWQVVAPEERAHTDRCLGCAARFEGLIIC